MSLSKRAVAELFGTFWLVFGGCGSAVLAAAFPGLGIGFAGVALAFGLTVLTMAFAIGHISGCHLNPAISVGLWAGRRFPGSELLPYIAAQVLGAIAAAGVLFVIASGKAGLQPGGRIRLQRLRGTFARRILPAGLPGGRSRADVCVPVRHHGRDQQARAGGLRADCHRPVPDSDPPGRHSGDEHVGESGSQHRAGAVCRRLGTRATVAVLGGADPWRLAGRRGLQMAV